MSLEFEVAYSEIDNLFSLPEGYPGIVTGDNY